MQPPYMVRRLLLPRTTNIMVRLGQDKRPDLLRPKAPTRRAMAATEEVVVGVAVAVVVLTATAQVHRLKTNQMPAEIY